VEAGSFGFPFRQKCENLNEVGVQGGRIPLEAVVGTFLVDETIVREEGTGPEMALGPLQGKSLLITLGITRIIEQENLDISIWGSNGSGDWGSKPLLSFPQKFYCGVYQLVLDLSQHPEITHLRAAWKVGRWGRGEPNPLFGFYLFAQDTADRALTAMSA
jgi:hypothetical protein